MDEIFGMLEFVFCCRRVGRIFEDDEFLLNVVEFFKMIDMLLVIDVFGVENVVVNNGYVYFYKSFWVSSDLLF